MIGDCKMTHLSPTEWRKRVQKKIGKITNEVWVAVVEDGLIEDANADAVPREAGKSAQIEAQEAALDTLIEEVEKYLKGYYSGLAAKPRLPKPQKIQDTPSIEIPPDKRFLGLTKIISSLMNKEEDIKKFRSEVLQGKLLTPEEASKWIEEQAAREKHTLTISFDVDSGEGWEDRLLEEVKQFVQTQKDGKLLPFKVGMATTTLAYIKPPSQWVHRVVINKNSTLGRLKHLANKYQGFWKEAGAVHFILTGIAYPISPAKVGAKINSFGLNRVSLEVSPHLPGSKVMELYLEERKKLLMLSGNRQEKSRRLTEKHVSLAVFVVEEMGSWAMKLRKWNRKYPQWAYPQTARSTFARDCRKAYERLTGWKWNDEQNTT
jgi:hypothetical protein